MILADDLKKPAISTHDVPPGIPFNLSLDERVGHCRFLSLAVQNLENLDMRAQQRKRRKRGETPKNNL
jgi:hypothetical protein